MRELREGAHTEQELAAMMVRLDWLIVQAARDHKWYEAADLERLREDVVYLRMTALRNRWPRPRQLEVNRARLLAGLKV